MIPKKYSIGGHLFAAGLGTRLAPLTNTIPKPLIEIHGEPIINYSVALLSSIPGMKNISINTYHLSNQFKSLNLPPNCLLYKETELCGHGNTLRFWARHHDEDVIVACNADTIFSTSPTRIKQLLTIFMNDSLSPALAVFVKNDPNGPLAVSSQGTLVGAKRKGELYQYPGTPANTQYTFVDAVGIYFIRKSVYTNISSILLEEPFVGFFGKNDLIERLIFKGHKVLTLDAGGSEAWGITTLKDIEILNNMQFNLPYATGK